RPQTSPPSTEETLLTTARVEEEADAGPAPPPESADVPAPAAEAPVVTPVASPASSRELAAGLPPNSREMPPSINKLGQDTEDVPVSSPPLMVEEDSVSTPSRWLEATPPDGPP